MVERSLPTPEVHSLNPVIGKLLSRTFVTVNFIEKSKIKKKKPLLNINTGAYLHWREPPGLLNERGPHDQKTDFSQCSYVLIKYFVCFKRQKESWNMYIF